VSDRKSASIAARAALITALITALIAAGAGAPRVVAQAPPASPGARASAVDTLLDPRTNAALQRLLESAVAAGLPDAPLRNRIRQGAARRISGERVLALVRAHADSMRAARDALGQRASADELDAGAAALHAGATRPMLRQLRATRGEGTATTALVVLTDLLWRGVAPGDAAAAVASIARRSPDRRLLELQGAVAREGAPASARLLQALVERVAAGEGGAGARPPPRRPEPPTDSVPGRALSGALTVSSLSAPSSASPDALLAEGAMALPIGRRWEATPWAALRTGESTRWGAALTIARTFQPTSSTGSRAWISGEVRSGVSGTRDALPLHSGLEVRTSRDRRSPDVAATGGVELLRPVGNWTVGGALAMGLTHFSRQETHLVSRTVPGVRDTLTPRPDTLAPRTEWVAEQRWFARTGSALRGTVSLLRGDLRVEGAISRQLGAWWGTSDSAASRPRAMLSVAAEQRIAPWASVVGQWASRDASGVHGTLALTDARWQLGIRLAERPARRPPRRSPSIAGPGDVETVRVEVASVAPDSSSPAALVPMARVRVQLAGALAGGRLVEVEGDLTEWQPAALRPEGHRTFAASFPVTTAVVRLRLRVDGGPWLLPPGAATQRDDFGDEVAVFVLAPER